MKRPKAPQWVEVVSHVSDEALYRYPDEYQTTMRERMLVNLLVETHRNDMKWVGWPEFGEELNVAPFGDRRLHLGVWAVPA